MAYIALYRAYRPKTFDDVIGQEAVIQTLSNALKFNQTSHAYLFSGPRGTGKHRLQKYLQKQLIVFKKKTKHTIIVMSYIHSNHRICQIL